MIAKQTIKAYSPALPAAFLFSQAPASDIRAATERVRLASVKGGKSSGASKHS